jgi:Cell Wall Hydrolase
VKKYLAIFTMLVISACQSQPKYVIKYKDDTTSNQDVGAIEQSPFTNRTRPLIEERAGSKSSIRTVQSAPTAYAYSVAPQNFSERECLARAMFYEAHVHDHASLMAVGTVLANRLESRKYPNTYCEVANQPYQFSSNPLQRTPSPGELDYSMLVANEIMQGIRHPRMEGILYFRTENTPLPENTTIVETIGGNTYFRYN